MTKKNDIEKISVKKVKKPIAKKSVLKSVKSENKNNTINRNKKSNFGSIFIIIIFTTLIVGGGIYSWQDRINKKENINSAEKIKNIKFDFEARMNNIKNKLAGIETSNVELKAKNSELEEKARLLNGAKKFFLNKDIGISFDYPAIFGEVDFQIEEIATGTKFIGTFSKNKNLIFQGISNNYILENNASSTIINISDTKGYYKKQDKFYFQTVREDNLADYEIKEFKIIKCVNSEALLIDKNSFLNNEEDNFQINIGENIGALINLKNEEYPGMIFINSDFNKMPLENFIEIIKTIKIN